MRKYFGTDGIRRIANTELTPKLVFEVAKAGAYVLSKHTNHTPTILIGRDTRISGTLIESAMTAGFLSYGANVKLLGVIPTPAVAYLTKKLNADASVVISASHNTYEFNGIKFFSNKGMKISDDLEEEIEQIIESEKIKELVAENDKIGVSNNSEELINQYIDFFEKLFLKDIEKNNYNKFKVLIDTANGATYDVAEKIYKKLGIKFDIINNNPDGININKNCGSTHIEDLKEKVIKGKYNIGIAYDGDGDRCLAIDENGELIDGDKIIAIVSNYFKEKNILKNNTVVATIMSNLGFKKYTEKNNINFVETKVGDRYVLEEMLKNNYNLGGEQSGHIIFLDYNPTGDGILTSLMLIKILLENKIEASNASKIMNTYPQILVNAKVSTDKKNYYKNIEEIKLKIEQVEDEFKSDGRVLIRPSGTEPLIRVMIEGSNLEKMKKEANELARIIEKNLN